MDRDAIHRTSTGKIFYLTDLEGNPLKYEEHKDIFLRHHLANLEVGQILRSSEKGVMLKRYK